MDYRKALIYFFSGVVARLTPFVLVPVMTYNLEVDEFGKLTIFLTFVLLADALFGMSMHASVTKNFFFLSKQEMAKLIGNTFCILTVSSLFCSLITLLGLAIFPTLQADWFILLAIPVTVFTTGVIQHLLALFRNQERAILYAIVEIGRSISILLFSLFFIFFSDLNWKSQIVAILICQLVLVPWIIYYLISNGYFKLSFNKGAIKKIIIFSLPLIPYSLGSLMLQSSDKFLLGKLVGLESVGLYGAAFGYGQLLLLFSDPVQKVWAPFCYKSIASNKNMKKRIVKTIYSICSLYFVIAIALLPASMFLFSITVDPRYSEAVVVLPILTFSFCLLAIYRLFFPIIVSHNKTTFFAAAVCISLAINVLANLVWIPNYGIVGAAYSSLLAFFILLLVTVWFQNHIYSLPWRSLFKHV